MEICKDPIIANDPQNQEKYLKLYCQSGLPSIPIKDNLENIEEGSLWGKFLVKLVHTQLLGFLLSKLNKLKLEVEWLLCTAAPDSLFASFGKSIPCVYELWKGNNKLKQPV